MILEEKFIMTPIETIMEEAVGACSVLGGGIETYPISEYVFQSMFLKMTGSQEQKLRCICWYVATYDYLFRHDYLDKYKELHQFSALSDKTAVYLMIREFILRHDASAVNIVDSEKGMCIKEAAASIVTVFGLSPLKEWNLRQYQDFKQWAKGVGIDEVANGGKLLSGTMKELYDNLHDNRNRYAHNTLSYQQNLPSMKSLVKGGDIGNYYEWFFLLIIIDKIFINRFERVKEIIAHFE